jgi:hypothetical protein
MAAPKYTDRIKAQELRSLALAEMINALRGEDQEFKKALLLRLAGSVLPRLSEVTGENGEAMKITIEVAGVIAQKNDIAPVTESDSK